MKIQDLYRLNNGERVASPKHNAIFEIVAVDFDDEELPIMIKFVRGPETIYGRDPSNTFGDTPVQWIYADIDDLYDGVTLKDLHPITKVTSGESNEPRIPEPPKVELPTGKQAYDKALEVNLMRVALKLKTAVEDGDASILLTDNEVVFLKDMLILKGFTIETNKLRWGVK